MNFDHTMDSNDNGGDDGGFGEEIEESIDRAPANPEKSSGAKLPNGPKGLENGNVGLKWLSS